MTSRTDKIQGLIGVSKSFPRWIAGGPSDPSRLSGAMLREVDRNLFVGSALSAPHMPVPPSSLVVVQLSKRCPPFPGARGTLFRPFRDCEPIPVSVLRDVVALAGVTGVTGERRPMLVQCYAGLSRSAAVAYAVLRMVDGLTHDDAFARVAHSREHHDGTDRWPHPVTLASANAWCDAQTEGRAA